MFRVRIPVRADRRSSRDFNEVCKFATTEDIYVVEHAKRILILGGPGSGKSHLAKLMGRTGRWQHIEVDRLYWVDKKGGAIQPDFEARMKNAIKAKEWIVEGHYRKIKTYLKMAPPDLIILIEVSPWRRLWRLVRRDVSEFLRGKRRTSDLWFVLRERPLFHEPELVKEWCVPVLNVSVSSFDYYR